MLSQSKFILVADTSSGAVRRLYLPGMDENDLTSKMRKFATEEEPKSSVYCMCSDFSTDFNTVLFYQEQG